MVRLKSNAATKRLAKLPFAPIVAGMFGLVAGVLVMATPIWLLESAVLRLGLPNILPPTAPPLGGTARALLTMMAAFGTGIGLWLVLTLSGRLSSRRRAMAGGGVVRPEALKTSKAMPLPDLPYSDSRRAPIFAEDELGSPLMSDDARDLGAVLASVDVPASEAKAEPVDESLVLDQAVPPMAESEERIVLIPPEPLIVPEPAMATETVVEMPAAPLTPPATDQPSVAAMLERLEAGLAKRVATGRSLKPPMSRDALLARMTVQR
jgi:hypothetical protein